MITGVDLDVQILAGEGLAIKDKAVFGRGSSDPYVKVVQGTKELYKTKVIEKNLSPAWNESFKVFVPEKKRVENLVFKIFDWDRMSDHDPMGEVTVSLQDMKDIDNWYPVQACKGTTNVSGKLHLVIKFNVRKSIDLGTQQSMAIQGTMLAAGLGWDMNGNIPVDLDLAVVGVSHKGEVLMDETVYFADLTNSNGSIRHSGDEKEGDENLGSGDDEVVILDLNRIPANVLALFVIATVSSPKQSFGDIKNACLRLVDVGYNAELCRYHPAVVGHNTALLMCRLARVQVAGQPPWKLNVVGTADACARDFGSLIPEIKTLMYDLVPTIKVDPKERVCLLRKGGIVRLRDYCGPEGIPKRLTFGLAWDMRAGKEVDLDASAIMLKSDLTVFDQVYFRHLKSKDNSIQHCGDEREGDAVGDDEKINIDLTTVNQECAYIGFTINSFSGVELDDVAKCKCHIFETESKRDICKYKLSKTKALDGKTALLVAVLYRDGGTGEWVLQIISEAAMGRTCTELVDELQAFLKKRDPVPLGPVRPAAMNAGYMMANTRAGEKPTINVTVPAGGVVGMQLVVNGPKGPLWCTIPDGCAPGQTFPVYV
jgi:tellurium resistance protein TerZ